MESTLNRRQFAIGSAATVSGGLIGGLVGSRLAQGQPVRFDRRLPIPRFIDAAKQGNAVEFSSGRHAFVKGKPVRSYGYSAPALGPVVRLRRGDEVKMTVENALDADTTVDWHRLLVPGDVDAARTRSSSQAVHGARDSRLTSRRQLLGFILICTMTQRDRSIWGLRD